MEEAALEVEDEEVEESESESDELESDESLSDESEDDELEDSSASSFNAASSFNFFSRFFKCLRKSKVSPAKPIYEKKLMAKREFFG